MYKSGNFMAFPDALWHTTLWTIGFCALTENIAVINVIYWMLNLIILIKGWLNMCQQS